MTLLREGRLKQPYVWTRPRRTKAMAVKADVWSRPDDPLDKGASFYMLFRVRHMVSPIFHFKKRHGSRGASQAHRKRDIHW